MGSIFAVTIALADSLYSIDSSTEVIPTLIRPREFMQSLAWAMAAAQRDRSSKRLSEGVLRSTPPRLKEDGGETIFRFGVL